MNQQPDPATRIWTRTEIEKAYRDIARGLVPADQARQLERDIDAAVREGRIDRKRTSWYPKRMR